MGFIRKMRGGLRGLNNGPSSPELGSGSGPNDAEAEQAEQAAITASRYYYEDPIEQQRRAEGLGGEGDAIWNAYAEQGMPVEKRIVLHDEAGRRFEAGTVTMKNADGRRATVPTVLTEVDGKTQEVPVVGWYVDRNSATGITVYTGQNEEVRELLMHTAVEGFFEGRTQVKAAIDLSILQMSESPGQPTDFMTIHMLLPDKSKPDDSIAYLPPSVDPEMLPPEKANRAERYAEHFRASLEESELGRELLQLTASDAAEA